MIRVFFIVSLVFLQSCGAIFNKKTVPLSINSSPIDAIVYIDGQNYGRTPLLVDVEPKNYRVKLVKDGYSDSDFVMETYQSLRRESGERTACFLDAVGVVLVLPIFSFSSVFCRDFKQPEITIRLSETLAHPSYNSNQRYKIPTNFR